MNDFVNDAEYERRRLNEKLRDAEERRMIRLMQHQQEGLFHTLQELIADWARTIIQAKRNHIKQARS